MMIAMFCFILISLVSQSTSTLVELCVKYEGDYEFYFQYNPAPGTINWPSTEIYKKGQEVCRNVVAGSPAMGRPFSAVELRNAGRRNSRTYYKNVNFSANSETAAITAFKKFWLPGNKWVLFSNGTSVLVKAEMNTSQTREEIEKQAVSFLAANGRVYPGSEFGDFGANYYPEVNGWMVSCHSGRIFTFVPGTENASEDRNKGFAIGMAGRGMRDKDATKLKIVFVCTE